MAEEIAMLDCYSGGRIISGFVRGTAVESIQGGIDPTEPMVLVLYKLLKKYRTVKTNRSIYSSL